MAESAKKESNTTTHTDTQAYDLVVIGGGINGTGIAVDAAGRGLKVLLCEQSDLASATSSKSSKLIHGGLRYLEQFDFRLVREALAEREVLLNKAPHVIWPLRFLLPHRPHLRPRWLIRLGLFLYDHLAKRTQLPDSKVVVQGNDSPLKSDIRLGFEYSDAWVDDARLVVLNAIQAREMGAKILTRCECVHAERHQGQWHVGLKSAHGPIQIKAKCLVNAAGPWVNNLFEGRIKSKAPKSVRLVKGSHILVQRFLTYSRAYILQNMDGRIVFVLPYEQDYSLIGTTDVEFQGDIAQAKISQQEIEYLLQVVNQHFKHQLTTDDVLHSFSGVRPLVSDKQSKAQSVSRDYVLTLDGKASEPPLLTVFGGKLTTYRKLAEAAMVKLAPYFSKLGPEWTEHLCLPGGDFSSQETLKTQLLQAFNFLSPKTVARYVRSYGTLSYRFLSGKQSLAALGQDFGHGLYEAEVRYLMTQEWAKEAEDVLWRRTKLGLKLSEQQQQALRDFMLAAAESPPLIDDQIDSAQGNLRAVDNESTAGSV